MKNIFSSFVVCIEAGNTDYRGLAVQSRVSSQEFIATGVTAEQQCGEFINFSSDDNTQEWQCPVRVIRVWGILGCMFIVVHLSRE